MKRFALLAVLALAAPPSFGASGTSGRERSRFVTQNCAGMPPVCAYPKKGVCVDGHWSCGDAMVPCPVSACAAPPAPCRYGPPTKDARGCDNGCGPLICEGGCSTPPPDCKAPKTPLCADGAWFCRDEKVPCPVANCAPPRAGCRLGPPTRDANGCEKGCGPLICDEVACPAVAVLCAAPPPGCRYGPPYPQDERGCQVGCGEVVCDRICPTYSCAALSGNCRYEDDGRRDENGCGAGCGRVVCAEPMLRKP